MTSRFLDALRDRPLLLDAGMGLRLIADHQVVAATEDTSSANLNSPGTVRRIHDEDLAAGADAILTNTFGANRPNLEHFNAAHGRDYNVNAINRAGVAIAREAAGPDRFVIGSIGPHRVWSVSLDRDFDFSYRKQAELLSNAGVDALVLETHTFEDAAFALRSIAPGARVPILASLHRWPEDAEGAARTLLDLGASVLGANCGRSTADVMRGLERLAGLVDVPLLAKPGTTEEEGPDAFAALVPRMLGMGVRLLGGCCGTKAEHVAAMRRALDSVES